MIYIFVLAAFVLALSIVKYIVRDDDYTKDPGKPFLPLRKTLTRLGTYFLLMAAGAFLIPIAPILKFTTITGGVVAGLLVGIVDFTLWEEVVERYAVPAPDKKKRNYYPGWLIVLVGFQLFPLIARWSLPEGEGLTAFWGLLLLMPSIAVGLYIVKNCAFFHLQKIRTIPGKFDYKMLTKQHDVMVSLL